MKGLYSYFLTLWFFRDELIRIRWILKNSWSKAWRFFIFHSNWDLQLIFPMHRYFKLKFLFFVKQLSRGIGPQRWFLKRRRKVDMHKDPSQQFLSTYSIQTFVRLMHTLSETPIIGMGVEFGFSLPNVIDFQMSCIVYWSLQILLTSLTAVLIS